MKEIEELIHKLISGRRDVKKKLGDVRDREQYIITPYLCDYETQITELTDTQKMAIRAIVTNDPVAWNALCDHLQESLMYSVYDPNEQGDEEDE